MSMLICNSDFLTTAVSKTTTSESPSALSENLYGSQNRGKVWRSAGFFSVTSANKGIVFQETNSVNLTANIAEDDYDNISDFLFAIKDALEAVGASTYTVTQDSVTKKITIESNGLGGGGIFKLMWTNVGSTAAGILGFSTAADDTGSLVYAADQVSIHSYERLIWDLGMASNPDAFIMIGKKLQAIKLTTSAVIKLQANATNAWNSPSYDVTLDYDEVAILKLKAEGDAGLAPTGYRYWSLYIEDPQNPDGAVELSKIFLGDYYSPVQGKPQFPFEVSKQDFSDVKQLNSGSKTVSIKLRSEVFSFDWMALTTGEKEVFDDISASVGTSENFFVVFDPNIVMSSDLNYSARYVRFDSNPSLQLETPGMWSSSWTLEEQV